MKKIISTIIIILFLSVPVSSETNFCHDEKSWKDWNAMAKKLPEDIPLQILHALRIGLCVKIEQNSISFDEATDLFDDMFDTVLNKRGEQEETEKRKNYKF